MAGEKLSPGVQRTQSTSGGNGAVRVALVLLAIAVAFRASPFTDNVKHFLQFPFSSGPVVKLDYGTFQGVSLEDGRVDAFLSIPYAAPPIGPLRFASPQPPLNHTFGQHAKKYGPGCPAQTLTMNPDLKIPLPEQGIHPVDENCLTANVFKPTGISADAELPVIFFVHGGGFALGTTSTMDLGRQLVGRSVEFGAPLVYVSANYRTNAFGFLAGEEVEKEGGLNAGLQDQRLALRWAQKYVHLFGGDPKKVTVWGQSAGAVSIGLHMVIEDEEELFRGAVMQSGAPMQLGSLEQGQIYYEQLAGLAGCASPPAPQTMLECMREVPTKDMIAAIDASPNLFGYDSVRLAWQPRVDGVLIKEDPVLSVSNGKVRKVPFVSGHGDDEGTLFALASLNVTTDDEFREYVKFLGYLTDEQADRIVNAYPNDQTKGAPFDTADKFMIAPQYKRIAAFVGDWTFLASTRYLLQHTAGTHESWAYVFKRYKHHHFLGVTHGTDMGILRADPKGMDFLINFAHNLNPNRAVHPDTALPHFWPQYHEKKGTSSDDPGVNLVYVDTGFVIEEDTAREEAMKVVMQIALEQAHGKTPRRAHD